jgi:hypothetical protein
MAQKEKRQSWRKTRRELHVSMSRHGRKWLKNVWRSTAREASDLDRFSPLTTVLGHRLVESYAARAQADSEAMEEALGVALKYGYAARMVLVDPTDQPSLKPSAFHLSAHSDVERLANDAGTPKRLLDPVRNVASERFDTVMTLPPEVWNGMVATATEKLQSRFTSSNDKRLTWRELSRELVEKFLRYGYVLRCLDEALDAEPTFRGPSPDGESETATEPEAAAERGNPA